MRMIGMVGVAMMMMLRRRMSRGERQQGRDARRSSSDARPAVVVGRADRDRSTVGADRRARAGAREWARREQMTRLAYFHELLT